MLPLFHWSFNAVLVGNRIQSSTTDPKGYAIEGNYPYVGRRVSVVLLLGKPMKRPCPHR
jgi:hypothetical protein